MNIYTGWVVNRHVTFCILHDTILYDMTTCITFASTGWMDCPDDGIREWTYRDCQVSGGFQSSIRSSNTGRLDKSLTSYHKNGRVMLKLHSK